MNIKTTIITILAVAVASLVSVEGELRGVIEGGVGEGGVSKEVGEGGVLKLFRKLFWFRALDAVSKYDFEAVNHILKLQYHILIRPIPI